MVSYELKSKNVQRMRSCVDISTPPFHRVKGFKSALPKGFFFLSTAHVIPIVQTYILVVLTDFNTDNSFVVGVFMVQVGRKARNVSIGM